MLIENCFSSSAAAAKARRSIRKDTAYQEL